MDPTDAVGTTQDSRAGSSITVVVPALNAAATIRRQIEALDRQRFDRRFLVIVVDNGSDDGTGELAAGVRSERHDLTVIHESRRGINVARNAGIAAAPDGMVFLCDADDEVDEGWLAAMVRALRPGTWVAGALGYDELNPPRTRRIWDVGSHSTMRPSDPYVDDTRGSNCGFLRSMWLALGGFDERLSGTGGDENEFFMRARAAGYRPVHVPAAVVNYRLRPGVRLMVRQRYRQGKNQVAMSRLPGGRLLPQRYTFPSCLRATAKAIAVGPRDLVGGRQYLWIASVSRHIGRLVALARRPIDLTEDRTRLGVFPRSDGPLVSVLMPVFNGGALVGRAVASIVDQTFADFELVVIDDGSTDETAAELARWADDPRVRVVRHEQNLGLVASLNQGLSLCRGELVARLDADDWSATTRLERQVAVFRSRPEIVLTSSAYDRVDADGRLIRRGVPPRSHAALAVAMLAGTRTQHSTMMFRRDAALAVGGYDASWYPVEDYDLWLRMLDFGEFAALATTETTYTAERPGSVSSTMGHAQDEQLWRRSQCYFEDLVGEPASDGEHRFSVRDVERATRSIRGRLRRRGIPTTGLDRQALLVANSSLQHHSRLRRALTVLLVAPRLALVGRLQMWRGVE